MLLYKVVFYTIATAGSESKSEAASIVLFLKHTHARNKVTQQYESNIYYIPNTSAYSVGLHYFMIRRECGARLVYS